MTFNKEEWDNAIESAYKKNAGKYKVAGFRAGKAPRKMVEQQYGAGIFVEDAIQDLFANNFGDELKLIDYPHIDFEFTEDGGLKLTAKCEVKLWISAQRWPYVETKPLHGSQRVVSKDEYGVTIQIEVYLNRELEQLVLSFGKDIKVLSPRILQEKIHSNIMENLSNYK